MTALLTIADTAEALQLSARSVRRLIATGELRASLVAGRGSWRVRREDLDAFVDARRHVPAAPSVPARATRAAAAAVPARSVRHRTGGRLELSKAQGSP